MLGYAQKKYDIDFPALLRARSRQVNDKILLNSMTYFKIF